MPSLPFPAGDSRIWMSTTASRMAGPISRFHLLPTSRPAATATRTPVKPLSCYYTAKCIIVYLFTQFSCKLAMHETLHDCKHGELE